MIPATHLSSVDLPEPLCPSSPTVSPCSTWSVTSRSAQNSSWVDLRKLIDALLERIRALVVQLEMLGDVVDLDRRAHQMFSARLSSSRPNTQNANNSRADRDGEQDAEVAQVPPLRHVRQRRHDLRLPSDRDRHDVVAPDRALHRDDDRRSADSAGPSRRSSRGPARRGRRSGVIQNQASSTSSSRCCVSRA